MAVGVAVWEERGGGVRGWKGGMKGLRIWMGKYRERGEWRMGMEGSYVRRIRMSNLKGVVNCFARFVWESAVRLLGLSDGSGWGG